VSDLKEKIDDDRRVAGKPGAHRRPAAGPNRVLVVGGVLAVFAAGAAALTLLWLDAAQSDEAPTQPIPPSMMMPTGTPTSASPAPPAKMPTPAPTTVTTPAEAQTEAPAPAQQAPVQPSPQPTTRNAEPPAAPPTPTTRAPISVAPEPRPAFPDQHPPLGGNGDKGGLLGRGGLL
jgi:hypothetical protein